MNNTDRLGESTRVRISERQRIELEREAAELDRELSYIIREAIDEHIARRLETERRRARRATAGTKGAKTNG